MIIGESLLFLRDTHSNKCDFQTDDQRKRQVFVNSVENCDLFARSSYITLYDDNNDDPTSERVVTNGLDVSRLCPIDSEDQNGCCVVESRV